MYALADKYDVTVLKNSALVSFKELPTSSQSDLLIGREHTHPFLVDA